MTNEFDHTIKIVILGDSGVGKTSIFYQYFNEPEKRFGITVDLKTKIIEINNKRIKLQIWNTSANENLDNIIASYLYNSNGIIIVYDISYGQSFKNCMKWLEKIHKYCNKKVIVKLVGNKCDCERRRVESKYGEKLAATHGISFIEASAKYNINIQKTFYDLAQAILTKGGLDPIISKK